MVDLGNTESKKGYCWGDNLSNSKIKLLTGFDILAERVNPSSLAIAMMKAKDCSYMPENKGIFLGSGVHTAKNNSQSLNGIA
jgi:hypothetical protein